MSKVRHVKEIILLTLFLIASFAVGIVSFLSSNQQARNTTSAQASSTCKCDDDDKCYPDGCSRKPKTDDNKFDESRYDSVCGDSSLDPGYRMPDRLIQHFCSEQQPSCCFDIAKHKDDRLCCFQERWTCHPSLCKGASGNGDCGKYWNLPDNGWKAYGCVKEGSNGEEIPYWGLPPGLSGTNSNPTNTPIPPINRPTQPVTQNTPTTTQIRPTIADPTPTTSRNSNLATTPSVVEPTQRAQQPSPTSGDTFVFDFKDDNETGNFGTNTQQQTTPADQNDNLQPTTAIKNENNQIAFSVPEIEIKSPKQALRDTLDRPTIEKLNVATEKPLAVAKNTFVTVKSYDQQLENTVEGWLFKIRVTVVNIFQ